MKKLTPYLAIVVLALLAGCAEKLPTSPATPPLTLTASAVPDTIPVGYRVGLTMQIQGGVPPYQATEWSYGEQVIGTMPSTSFTLNVLGQHLFRALVRDAAGSVDTASVTAVCVPLDSMPPDTVEIIVHDTLPPDTVRIIDTVWIDTSQYSGQFCGYIGGCTKSIAWFLAAPAGHYRLEFSAVTDKDQPAQTLTTTVGDSQYAWPVGTSKEFTVGDAALSGPQWVIVKSAVPPAYGHGISVCMTVTRL
ncbi:MAG: hypothetical protein V1916_00975 [Patescibacteria group bacterium]